MKIIPKKSLNMARPKWFKRALAWLSVVLYSVDVGSDFWVGIDLIIRCHYKFAASVFSGLFLPGFLFGWVNFISAGDCNPKAFFKALFFPITMLPYTFWGLVKAALNENYLSKAKL